MKTYQYFWNKFAQLQEKKNPTAIWLEESVEHHCFSCKTQKGCRLIKCNHETCNHYSHIDCAIQSSLLLMDYNCLIIYQCPEHFDKIRVCQCNKVYSPKDSLIFCSKCNECYHPQCIYGPNWTQQSNEFICQDCKRNIENLETKGKLAKMMKFNSAVEVLEPLNLLIFQISPIIDACLANSEEFFPISSVSDVLEICNNIISNGPNVSKSIYEAYQKLEIIELLNKWFQDLTNIKDGFDKEILSFVQSIVNKISLVFNKADLQNQLQLIISAIISLEQISERTNSKIAINEIISFHSMISSLLNIFKILESLIQQWRSKSFQELKETFRSTEPILSGYIFEPIFEYEEFHKPFQAYVHHFRDFICNNIVKEYDQIYSFLTENNKIHFKQFDNYLQKANLIGLDVPMLNQLKEIGTQTQDIQNSIETFLNQTPITSFECPEIEEKIKFSRVYPDSNDKFLFFLKIREFYYNLLALSKNNDADIKQSIKLKQFFQLHYSTIAFPVKSSMVLNLHSKIQNILEKLNIDHERQANILPSYSHTNTIELEELEEPYDNNKDVRTENVVDENGNLVLWVVNYLQNMKDVEEKHFQWLKELIYRISNPLISVDKVRMIHFRFQVLGFLLFCQQITMKSQLTKQNLSVINKQLNIHREFIEQQDTSQYYELFLQLSEIPRNLSNEGEIITVYDQVLNQTVKLFYDNYQKFSSLALPGSIEIGWLNNMYQSVIDHMCLYEMSFILNSNITIKLSEVVHLLDIASPLLKATNEWSEIKPKLTFPTSLKTQLGTFQTIFPSMIKQSEADFSNTSSQLLQLPSIYQSLPHWILTITTNLNYLRKWLKRWETLVDVYQELKDSIAFLPRNLYTSLKPNFDFLFIVTEFYPMLCSMLQLSIHEVSDWKWIFAELAPSTAKPIPIADYNNLVKLSFNLPEGYRKHFLYAKLQETFRVIFDQSKQWLKSAKSLLEEAEKPILAGRPLLRWGEFKDLFEKNRFGVIFSINIKDNYFYLKSNLEKMKASLASLLKPSLEFQERLLKLSLDELIEKVDTQLNDFFDLFSKQKKIDSEYILLIWLKNIVEFLKNFLLLQTSLKGKGKCLSISKARQFRNFGRKIITNPSDSILQYLKKFDIIDSVGPTKYNIGSHPIIQQAEKLFESYRIRIKKDSENDKLLIDELKSSELNLEKLYTIVNGMRNSKIVSDKNIVLQVDLILTTLWKPSNVIINDSSGNNDSTTFPLQEYVPLAQSLTYISLDFLSLGSEKGQAMDVKTADCCANPSCTNKLNDDSCFCSDDCSMRSSELYYLSLLKYRNALLMNIPLIDQVPNENNTFFNDYLAIADVSETIDPISLPEKFSEFLIALLQRNPSAVSLFCQSKEPNPTKSTSSSSQTDFRQTIRSAFESLFMNFIQKEQPESFIKNFQAVLLSRDLEDAIYFRYNDPSKGLDKNIYLRHAQMLLMNLKQTHNFNKIDSLLNNSLSLDKLLEFKKQDFVEDSIRKIRDEQNPIVLNQAPSIHEILEAKRREASGSTTYENNPNQRVFKSPEKSSTSSIAIESKNLDKLNNTDNRTDMIEQRVLEKKRLLSASNLPLASTKTQQELFGQKRPLTYISKDQPPPKLQKLTIQRLPSNDLNPPSNLDNVIDVPTNFNQLVDPNMNLICDDSSPILTLELSGAVPAIIQCAGLINNELTQNIIPRKLEMNSKTTASETNRYISELLSSRVSQKMIGTAVFLVDNNETYINYTHRYFNSDRVSFCQVRDILKIYIVSPQLKHSIQILKDINVKDLEKMHPDQSLLYGIIIKKLDSSTPILDFPRVTCSLTCFTNYRSKEPEPTKDIQDNRDTN